MPEPEDISTPIAPLPSSDAAGQPTSTQATPTPPQDPQPKLAPFSPLGGAQVEVGSSHYSSNSQPHSPIGLISQTKPTIYSNLASTTAANQPDNQMPVTPNIYPDYLQDKGSSKGVLFAFLVITFLLFAISLSLGGIYAIAYNYIDINKPEISKPISHFVQSIPFMPKTPLFIIEQSVISHSKVTVFSSEASAELKSDAFKELLNKNVLLFQVKGKFDYTDPKNFKFTSNISLTDEFNLDALSVDSKIYFKINKLPNDLLAQIGVPPTQASIFTSKWIYFDTKEIEKQVSKQVKTSEPETLSDADIKKITKVFTQEYVLDEIKLTEDTLDGKKVFKLTFNPSKDTIVRIISDLMAEFPQENSTVKPSEFTDTVKDLKFEAWFEKTKYYSEKMTVTADMIIDDRDSYQSVGSGDFAKKNSTINVNYTVKMSDFGKPFLAEAPSPAITIEEYFESISKQLMPPPQSL